MKDIQVFDRVSAFLHPGKPFEVPRTLGHDGVELAASIKKTSVKAIPRRVCAGRGLSCNATRCPD